VIVCKGRFDLDGAEEGVRVLRPVVDVAYQMRFFRRDIARRNEGSFSCDSEGQKDGKKTGGKGEGAYRGRRSRRKMGDVERGGNG
jgi:hypothetical protein